ncbi:Amino acid transporter [Halanaeroarchaeum sp. HSR-CO]|nr:hypothetical protein [Halanaeroarchaeum sp. HSR-CO]UWG47845.1 Amino acid transporter [Halanaeroarchaeum sp. HSR-CO]
MEKRRTVPVKLDVDSDDAALLEDTIDELAEQITAPVTSQLVEGADQPAALIQAIHSADAFVTCSGRRGIRGAVLGRPSDRIIAGSDVTAISVTSSETESSRLRGLARRLVFSTT